MKKSISLVVVSVLATAIITAAFSVFVLFPMMTPEPVPVTESPTVEAEGISEPEKTDDEDVVKVNKDDYEYLVSLYDKYKKAEALEQYIRENYYQDVSEVDFMSEMLKGMFRALDDPYSVYFTPKEFKDYNDSARGEYDGIGVVVSPGEDGYITVVSPFQGSPGFEAGIKPNDKILQVDGVEYSAEELEEAVSNIRGPAGTVVTLTIRRDLDTFDVEVERRKIILEAVNSEVLDNNIGYIQMTSFDQDVAEELRQHLDTLEAQNIEGLILDLRFNGGGYLNQCLQVTDMLIGEGVIVKTKDNQGNVDIDYSDADKIDYPLVIIVNEGSASASEILTGAVKDNEEGTIVGTTTFGKGLVQTMLPLITFDESGFKLTIEQYFTPDDHYINEIGIEPDVVIEDDTETEEDEQLNKAIEIMMEKIN
ncbi:S41 family peptidase [Acidaminobacter sp. JC074]|uniref:S41 family peptidase n=1 Tax=Acidaminobacter sp. JC074 TaxID=2530199 RepID=UPI001F0F32CC|nr:S41 family peptidase [Acidaminobacter sp. JC074]MCH4890757.1 S41 family peptidase [Acidaminobacter sp. JC074]